MGICGHFFLCSLLPHIVMRPTRKRILSSDHMAQFDDEHKNAFGTTVDPLLRDLDYGSGWFAKTLEYKDWYELSNAKRVH